MKVVAGRFGGLIVPGIVVLAALIVLVLLGNWQMRRLVWKEDLIAQASERPAGPVQALPPATEWPDLDVAGSVYRPYRLTGRFLHGGEAHVFTSLPVRPEGYAGPGYWVVVPFAVSGGGIVLVNRGFAPQGRHLVGARGESPPTGLITVTGLMRPDEARGFFLPDDEPQNNRFYARNIGDIAAAKQLSGPVAPFTIDLVAAETPASGLPQAGETRMVFTNNHLQYAITWYGLAAALLAVFAAFAWRRLSVRPQTQP